jgi:hypothetical protein
VGNKHLWCIIFVLLFLSECSNESPRRESIREDYCPEKYGCVNKKFIQLFEDRCSEKEKGCRFSFKELFGEMDNVYFSHKLMLWFNECTTFPMSEIMKKTNTEMCRYILFETGQKITRYLRSSCLSDVHIAEKNVISFDSDVAEMVAVMSADEIVHMRKEVQGDMVYYYISPEKSQVLEFKGDECIHSP